ncbi:hypothetical protein Lmor_0157 [Legionella moravica]|uniref:Uncharacterized protein n=1 Tax=Legionella moravica TaxID=39962 RepID=A0A378JWA0_9GAMM|nr:hypothetical protein [Legionella moravica]KTD39229.1 hypothetical protein Lmor_0157 [Legionella moravica]STX61762.1 Uncharacterised protein [Legionella moravica]
MKINPNAFFTRQQPKDSNDDRRMKKDETPHKYTQKAKGTLHHYINDEVQDVLEELHGKYNPHAYDSYSDDDYASDEESNGLKLSIPAGL